MRIMRVATTVRQKEDIFFAPEEHNVNRKANSKVLVRSGGAQ
jgi:hypothetical protein